MAAILSLGFGQLWRLSWWDYHLYLLAGFSATSWAVVAETRRSRSLSGAASTTRSASTIASRSVSTLIRARARSASC